MARQQIVQGRIHQRRDLARLLETHSDRRTEMHVDLARLDSRKEIPPKPGQDQDERSDGRREKYHDEPTAPRNRFRQQFLVSVAEAVESPLESHMKAAEKTSGRAARLTRGYLPA